MPLIHTKEGVHPFNPEFIYHSLLRETHLSIENAKLITKDVLRWLISAHLHLITAPLIREVANVHLLKNKFEKERLQYTRIGLPFYDLKMLFEGISEEETLKEQIYDWIITEYQAVKELIEKDDLIMNCRKIN